MSLEQELRDGASELIKLADDLKYGRAKEVDQTFGHVYEHVIRQEYKNSGITKSGEGIEMMTVVKCTDFLKLWGIWYYIATCPRTGIRFVERSEEMKVLVIENLPDHHGTFGVDVDLTGKEIEVLWIGKSECGGLLFEVLEQEKYWTPRVLGEWLGVCSHEIKSLVAAASSLEGNNAGETM